MAIKLKDFVPRDYRKFASKKYLPTFVIALIVGVCVLLYLGVSISYKNDEKRLRNRFEAGEKELAATFDNMWKIISQQAQIADQYKEAFAKVYPEIMNERYSGEQSTLFKFVQEHNPDFKIDLYTKLADTVALERTRFLMVQKKVVSIWQEHKDTVTTWPGSFFFSDKYVIDWKPITSEKTEEAVRTRQENDTGLFGKK